MKHSDSTPDLYFLGSLFFKFDSKIKFGGELIYFRTIFKNIGFLV